jgi:hypothetical protein
MWWGRGSLLILGGTKREGQNASVASSAIFQAPFRDKVI